MSDLETVSIAQAFQNMLSAAQLINPDTTLHDVVTFIVDEDQPSLIEGPKLTLANTALFALLALPSVRATGSSPWWDFASRYNISSWTGADTVYKVVNGISADINELIGSYSGDLTMQQDSHFWVKDDCFFLADNGTLCVNTGRGNAPVLATEQQVELYCKEKYANASYSGTSAAALFGNQLQVYKRETHGDYYDKLAICLRNGTDLSLLRDVQTIDCSDAITAAPNFEIDFSKLNSYTHANELVYTLALQPYVENQPKYVIRFECDGKFVYLVRERAPQIWTHLIFSEHKYDCNVFGLCESFPTQFKFSNKSSPEVHTLPFLNIDDNVQSGIYGELGPSNLRQIDSVSVENEALVFTSNTNIPISHHLAYYGILDVPDTTTYTSIKNAVNVLIGKIDGVLQSAVQFVTYHTRFSELKGNLTVLAAKTYPQTYPGVFNGNVNKLKTINSDLNRELTSFEELRTEQNVLKWYNACMLDPSNNGTNFKEAIRFGMSKRSHAGTFEQFLWENQGKSPITASLPTISSFSYVLSEFIDAFSNATEAFKTFISASVQPFFITVNESLDQFTVLTNNSCTALNTTYATYRQNYDNAQQQAVRLEQTHAFIARQASSYALLESLAPSAAPGFGQEITNNAQRILSGTSVVPSRFDTTLGMLDVYNRSSPNAANLTDAAFEQALWFVGDFYGIYSGTFQDRFLFNASLIEDDMVRRIAASLTLRNITSEYATLRTVPEAYPRQTEAAAVFALFATLSLVTLGVSAYSSSNATDSFGDVVVDSEPDTLDSISYVDKRGDDFYRVTRSVYNGVVGAKIDTDITGSINNEKIAFWLNTDTVAQRTNMASLLSMMNAFERWAITAKLATIVPNNGPMMKNARKAIRDIPSELIGKHARKTADRYITFISVTSNSSQVEGTDYLLSAVNGSSGDTQGIWSVSGSFDVKTTDIDDHPYRKLHMGFFLPTQVKYIADADHKLVVPKDKHKRTQKQKLDVVNDVFKLLL